MEGRDSGSRWDPSETGRRCPAEKREPGAAEVVARHRRQGARRSRRSTRRRLSYVVGTEWVHPDESGRRRDAARSYAIQPGNPAKGSMRHAFTLIELTVTLCIVSILSAIAVPRAGRFLDSIHVRSAVIEIESLFSTGRHLAIARASQV